MFACYIWRSNITFYNRFWTSQKIPRSNMIPNKTPPTITKDIFSNKKYHVLWRTLGEGRGDRFKLSPNVLNDILVIFYDDFLFKKTNCIIVTQRSNGSIGKEVQRVNLILPATHCINFIYIFILACKYENSIFKSMYYRAYALSKIFTW